MTHLKWQKLISSTQIHGSELIYAVLIISTAPELIKLFFAVLDVSLTMGFIRCYKTEGFLHLYLLFLYMFYAIFIRYNRLRWRKSKAANVHINHRRLFLFILKADPRFNVHSK